MYLFGISFSGEKDSIASEDSRTPHENHGGSMTADSDSSLTEGTIISLSDALSGSDDDRAQSISADDDILGHESIHSQLISESQSQHVLLSSIEPNSINRGDVQESVEPETVEESSEEISSVSIVQSYNAILQCSEQAFATHPDLEIDRFSPFTESSLLSDETHFIAEPQLTVDPGASEVEERSEEISAAPIVQRYGAAPRVSCLELSSSELAFSDVSPPIDSSEVGLTEPHMVIAEHKVPKQLMGKQMEEQALDYSEGISAAPIMQRCSTVPIGTVLDPVVTVDSASPSITEPQPLSNRSIDFDGRGSDPTASGASQNVCKVATPLPTDSSTTEPSLDSTEKDSIEPSSVEKFEILETKEVPKNMATKAVEEVESILRKYADSAGVDIKTFAELCQSHVLSSMKCLNLRDVPSVNITSQLNTGEVISDNFVVMPEFENDSFSIIAKESQKRLRSLRSDYCLNEVEFLRKFARKEDGTTNPQTYRRFSLPVSRRKRESLRKFVRRMVHSVVYIHQRNQADYISIVLPVAIVVGLRKNYQFIAADHRKFLSNAPEFYSTQAIAYWFENKSICTRAHMRYSRY